MKKIYYIFLLLLLFVIPKDIFAQNGFEMGYIINDNYDTIYGYVKDRKNPPVSKLYKSVRFKKYSSNLFNQKYYPNQILAFKHGSRVYESMWINVTTSFFVEEYKSINNYGSKKFLRDISKGYLTYYQKEYYDSESDNIYTVDLFKREEEEYILKVTQGVFGLKKKYLFTFKIALSWLIKFKPDK